jgi:hypothetical protein
MESNSGVFVDGRLFVPDPGAPQYPAPLHRGPFGLNDLEVGDCVEVPFGNRTPDIAFNRLHFHINRQHAKNPSIAYRLERLPHASRVTRVA